MRDARAAAARLAKKDEDSIVQEQDTPPSHVTISKEQYTILKRPEAEKLSNKKVFIRTINIDKAWDL